jgi:hypothetical protein
MYLVVAALVLIFASPLMAQPVTRTMSWDLSNPTVTNFGPDGFEVQATATATTAQARVKTGVFTIKCETVNGKLMGSWDITRAGEAKAVHGRPGSIKGNLGPVDFTPAATADALATIAINAPVLVNPKRRHPSKEAKAAGTFDGFANFVGKLTITKIAKK